jgi:hypothetical protein
MAKLRKTKWVCTKIVAMMQQGRTMWYLAREEPAPGHEEDVRPEQPAFPKFKLIRAAAESKKWGWHLAWYENKDRLVHNRSGGLLKTHYPAIYNWVETTLLEMHQSLADAKAERDYDKWDTRLKVEKPKVVQLKKVQD